MREPETVIRAKTLLKHARYLGAPLDDFFISVTKEEGFELIRWFRDEAKPDEVNLEQLDRDIELARKRGNPFYVLDNFRLYGLAILPRERVN